MLLKRTGGTDEQPVFSPKIADFGMVADELSSSSSPSDGVDGGDGTGSVAAHAWKGTYLYMSPEATGMNAEKGYPKGRIATNREEPLFGASDSFSFGVMLLIMMTRDARWFETDGLQLPSIIGKDGKRQEDMKTVATWYFNGKRPQFDGEFLPGLCGLGEEVNVPGHAQLNRRARNDVVFPPATAVLHVLQFSENRDQAPRKDPVFLRHGSSEGPCRGPRENPGGAEHGVGFAGPRLAVCADVDVVAVEKSVDHTRHEVRIQRLVIELGRHHDIRKAEVPAVHRNGPLPPRHPPPGILILRARARACAAGRASRFPRQQTRGGVLRHREERGRRCGGGGQRRGAALFERGCLDLNMQQNGGF